MVIGHQKGRDTKENLKRNFGMPHPEGYRKALRLMKLAAQVRRAGHHADRHAGRLARARRRGARAVGGDRAQHARDGRAADARSSPTVIGEGGSGGALALGVADRVLMLENSVYSVISPEGCAAILWKDASQRERAAEALKLTAQDLLRLKVIDEIIPEPVGGAHIDPDATGEALREALHPPRRRAPQDPPREAGAPPRREVRARWARTPRPDAADRRSPVQGQPQGLLPLGRRDGRRSALREAVIVEAERGRDLGRVTAVGETAAEEVRRRAAPAAPSAARRRRAEPLKPVVRRATAGGHPHRTTSSAAHEEDARRKVIERVRAHKLDMKVSDAEWQWDRKKLTIYFTAEKRVDFRALVRELAGAVPHPDRAAADRRARRGGAARRRRPLRPRVLLLDLAPRALARSTSALAKDQHLSLNPSQISGGCGRLLCCLRYEHEFYVDAAQALPQGRARRS